MHSRHAVRPLGGQPHTRGRLVGILRLPLDDRAASAHRRLGARAPSPHAHGWTAIRRESPALKDVGSQATQRRTVRVPDPGHLQPPRGGRSRSCADDRLAPTGCQARFLTGQNRGATVGRTLCRCPPWRGKGERFVFDGSLGGKFSTPQLHSWVVPQRSAWMRPGSRNTSRRRTLRGAARSHGERWHSLASRIPGTGISELQIERGAKPRVAAPRRYRLSNGWGDGKRGEAWFRPAEADANSPFILR